MDTYKSQYTGAEIDSAVTTVAQLVEQLKELLETQIDSTVLNTLIERVEAIEQALNTDTTMTIPLVTTTPTIPDNGYIKLYAKNINNTIGVYGLTAEGLEFSVNTYSIVDTYQDGSLQLATEFTNLANNGVVYYSNSNNNIYQVTNNVLETEGDISVVDESVDVTQDDIIDNVVETI